MTRGLLDTSVIIDVAAHLPRLPDEAAISAITIAEIHYGVLVARTAEQRARPLELLAFLEREAPDRRHRDRPQPAALHA